jgi:cytochrome c2
VPAALHNWGRWLALVSYCVIVAAPVLGVFYAWADELQIHLGSFVTLPNLMPRSRPVWMFTGYFHSGMGFMILVLSAAALVTTAWGLLRHGRGLLAIFPPGFGAQIFAGISTTVYSFATFRSPEPGPRAVAVFWAICALVWGVAWLIHRNPGPAEAAQPLGPVARIAAPVVALSLLGLGAYGPHALFRVTPWPMGETVSAPEGLTSHVAVADHPAARVPVTPETPFEKQVRADTYKWCRFCHTVEKNGPHLVGPNLYHIFGQKAGTVPNFTYTTVMADAGRHGLVWTDERIAWFIADPQKHMPGTAMIVSSGPIPDPKVQQAVVNLLRRETMVDVAAEPPLASSP